MTQMEQQFNSRNGAALPETEKEVIQRLKNSPHLYESYRGLNEDWRQRFVNFCRGKISLPLTYDPIFKWIFQPDVHPERLSRFVSSLLGIRVKVIRILPNEDSMLDGGTLLIMDLLGELEDGSLINIEIQKQGYAFPAERISCYTSDLLMRQYARVKGEKGSKFTYRDIKKVYVIVIYEKSAGIFHKIPDCYIHHGRTVFNTKLEMELMSECCLVALDVFRKIPYPKEKSEQTAWLSLLATENLKEAEKLILDYPWLEEIYQEIAALRQKPEEVLGMFSEALKILDQNTANYMIEELQKDVEERDAIIKEKENMIGEQKSVIGEQAAEIETLKKRIEELSK